MKYSILLFSFFFYIQFTYSQSLNSYVVSNLDIETVENISFIEARASNKTDLYFNLKYNFSIIVMDENYSSLKKSLEEFLKSQDGNSKTLNDFQKEYEKNKSSTREFKEEFFTLNPYETQSLYKLSLEVNSKDKVVVLFLIFDDQDNIVSRSRVILNENFNNENKEVQSAKSNGFQISGLVVEDTKTKSGKDFYDKFYFFYNYLNLKGNQVVKIDEMFSFRRTTRIIVSVGDETIHEFFAYPKEDYIEEMAKISVQRVYKYFENKKKEKSYISQY